jgi:uncharacterized membrane protein
MQDEDNPFKAPDARVDDLFPNSGNFIPDGQRVPAGHGLTWLAHGWKMFRQAPLIWIVISLIFGVIALVLGVIPGINLIFNLLIPVFVGGIMIGCKALEDGEELRIGHLFAGFSSHAGNLVLIGLIFLAGIVAMLIIMALVGGLGFGAAMMGGGMSAEAVAGASVLAMLVAMLLFVPLAMAVWYAPPLVVFHDVPPLEAVKVSFFACLKNFVPFLVYGVVFVVLAMLASLPLLLGWLVLIPVTQASVYAGYRDMFTRN